MNAAPHMGKELEMMISEEKPLSMFCCSVMNGLTYEYIQEDKFDVYVENRLLVKDVLEFQSSGSPVVVTRYVMYALKDEVWRIPAMKLTLQTMNRVGRADESVDRIIGGLLGYSEEEIDEYIDAGRHNIYCKK